MRKTWLWYSIIILFFIGLTGFFFGFGNAFLIGAEVTQPQAVDEEMSDTPEVLPEIHAEGDFQVVALGDSLARGTGDPDGGFVERLVQGMEEEQGVSVDLYNFSNEGMRSGELLEQITEPLLNQALADARYTVISIGGNDLRDIRNMPIESQDQAFEDQLEAYIDNLEKILEQIRQTNSDGMIIFIGLYNLQDDRYHEREVTYLLEWSHQTQQLLTQYGSTLFVPTRDLFQLNYQQFISFDGLHPNEEGHRAIARRILENTP